MNNTLSERAVLTTMIVSRYRAKGRSKEVDTRVTNYLQTKRKAGSTQIDLLDPKSIKKTQAAAYQVSKWYKSMTLPWDERSRILPSALHDRFIAGHNSRLESFRTAVDAFIIVYPQLLRTAQDELGYELYELMEFPNITEIRGKFGVNLSFNPVPVAGDFRIKLSNDELEKLREELNERNKATLARSMHDAWRRLHKVVEDMTEKIYKPKFRDTIVGNIKNLTDILPELNLAEDQELNNMREQVLKKLCRYTAEQLRSDEEKRNEVAGAATEIMGSMRRLRMDL